MGSLGLGTKSQSSARDSPGLPCLSHLISFCSLSRHQHPARHPPLFIWETPTEVSSPMNSCPARSSIHFPEHQGLLFLSSCSPWYISIHNICPKALWLFYLLFAIPSRGELSWVLLISVAGIRPRFFLNQWVNRWSTCMFILHHLSEFLSGQVCWLSGCTKYLEGKIFHPITLWWNHFFRHVWLDLMSLKETVGCQRGQAYPKVRVVASVRAFHGAVARLNCCPVLEMRIWPHFIKLLKMLIGRSYHCWFSLSSFLFPFFSFLFQPSFS